MTYGWAILVILVVLGILYLLNIFGNPIGTSCNVNFNYLCQSPSLASNGTASFTAGQNTEAPEYNLAFACTASVNSTSGGPFTNGTSPWQYMEENTSLSSTYNALDSYTLQSSYDVQVSGLPCFSTTGHLLANGNFLPLKTSFQGFFWIRFTQNAGAENATTNKWITTQLASVSLSVSQSSTHAYGVSTTAGTTTISKGTTTVSGKGKTTATTTATTTTPGTALLPFSSQLIILIAIVVIVVIVIVLYLRSRLTSS